VNGCRKTAATTLRQLHRALDLSFFEFTRYVRRWLERGAAGKEPYATLSMPVES
jgi:hypothetical protein